MTTVRERIDDAHDLAQARRLLRGPARPKPYRRRPMWANPDMHKSEAGWTACIDSLRQRKPGRYRPRMKP